MTKYFPQIGIIGGSGLYSLDNLTVVDTVQVDTPWGKPSSPITIASLAAENGPPVHIAFLARHGPGHIYTPSKVPNQANIAALKSLGVKAILAFSAVGSLREEIRPGDLIVPDQVIDRTKGVRPYTFFEDTVAHAMFGDPFSVSFSDFIASHLGTAVSSFSSHVNPDDPPRVHTNKTVIVMEGPQFSSRAESLFYRQIGGDIINMSTLPEAKLAREAEIAYSLIATSTDYDAWRTGFAPVTVEEVLKVLHTNAALAKHIAATVLPSLHEWVSKNYDQEGIKGSMKYAVITHKVLPSEKKKLSFILPEYFQ